ncbi:MAG: hypothetical protein WCA81_13795 [Rhizomicrobium sp.]
MRKLHPTILRTCFAAAVCTAIAAAHAAVPRDWRVYRNVTLGYTIAYPEGWSVERNYVYPGFGPDHEIRGVAFHIPHSMARGTNLSVNLTALSVESVSGAGRCEAGRFLSDPQNLHSIVENGTIYSTAESQDAGAGNRYEEIVFALIGSSPCLGIRYFIHSTNIGNYDPGVVQEFDRAKLLAEFDRIRHTLAVSQPAHPAGAQQ